MKSISKAHFFKTGVMLLPFVFGACTTDESSSAWERPDSFGDVLYERHLGKGTSAAFECKVYSQNNHVSLEMIFDVPAYQSTMNAVYYFEVGDPANMYVDILLSGMFQDESDDACAGLKANNEGMKVSCSRSHVTGKSELESVSEASSSLVLGMMVPKFKSQCDNFYDNYKDIMSDLPGRWNYGNGEPAEPALLCDVNLTDDALHMNVDYSTRSMAMEVTHYSINGEPMGAFRVAESYAGVPADTLAMICSAYRQESDLSGVYCEGSTISYLAPEEQDGEVMTLEDMAVVYKKEVCPGLLDGSLSMEDLWFND